MRTPEPRGDHEATGISRRSRWHGGSVAACRTRAATDACDRICSRRNACRDRAESGRLSPCPTDRAAGRVPHIHRPSTAVFGRLIAGCGRLCHRFATPCPAECAAIARISASDATGGRRSPVQAKASVWKSKAVCLEQREPAGGVNFPQTRAQEEHSAADISTLDDAPTNGIP